MDIPTGHRGNSDSLHVVGLTTSQEMRTREVEAKLVGVREKYKVVESTLKKNLDNTTYINRTLFRVNQLINGKDPDSADLLMDDILNGINLGLIQKDKPGFHEVGSWGQCDSCFCALPPGGDSSWDLEWYRCTKCPDLDECSSCWNTKKKAHKGHPHKMLKMKQTSDFSSSGRQSTQRDILCFDGGGIRG
jgi:hypothetical protein